MRSLIVGLGFLVGCGGSQGFQPVVSRTIETSVVVEPQSVVQGDVLQIRVEVTNRSGAPLRLGFSHGCQVGYRVVSPDGELLEILRACITIPTWMDLDPGETKGDMFEFSTVVPKGAEWPSDGGMLPLGTYRVQGGVLGYAEDYPWVEAEFVIRGR